MKGLILIAALLLCAAPLVTAEEANGRRFVHLNVEVSLDEAGQVTSIEYDEAIPDSIRAPLAGRPLGRTCVRTALGGRR